MGQFTDVALGPTQPSAPYTWFLMTFARSMHAVKGMAIKIKRPVCLRYDNPSRNEFVTTERFILAVRTVPISCLYTTGISAACECDQNSR